MYVCVGVLFVYVRFLAWYVYVEGIVYDYFKVYYFSTIRGRMLYWENKGKFWFRFTLWRWTQLTPNLDVSRDWSVSYGIGRSHTGLVCLGQDWSVSALIGRSQTG